MSLSISATTRYTRKNFVDRLSFSPQGAQSVHDIEPAGVEDAEHLGQIAAAFQNLATLSDDRPLALARLKRRAFLMEVEPIFCDLIIRRFEALTGTKASLLKS